MRTLARGILILAGLLAAWQFLVVVSGVEPFILPGPWQVMLRFAGQFALIAGHAGITLAEIVIGLALGALLGAGAALTIAAMAPVRRWLLPVLVVTQAIPVFAIAPMLVLWLGYGMASKVAMACLIIFFPVTAAFLDGLRRTEPGWIDLGRTMLAGAPRRRRFALLWHVRVPAALPALASGLRIAAAVAPIGAVVGEWVGSSAGLGYLMLHANGRMQIDLMFAALLALALIAVALYFLIDAGLRLALPWQPDRDPPPERS